MAEVVIVTVPHEIGRMLGEMKTYDPPRLRWVVPDFTTTQPARLQEGVKWRSATAEGIEWRDVPTVVLKGEDPKEWGR